MNPRTRGTGSDAYPRPTEAAFDRAAWLLFALGLVALASWAAYVYLQTHAGIVVVSR